MNIQEIEVSKINPAAYNPRIDLQAGDHEYEKLKKSIEEFGYIDPLIWNEQTGNLVGGHQRFKILLEGNPEKLTVSVVDLDVNLEKALNVALNKIEGGWDDELLVQLLNDISTNSNNIELTGFEEKEISKLIEGMMQLPTNELGDFSNNELDLESFNENEFDCKCPKCGYVFNKE
ncbi:ParB N-terminal domain-containing protein [Listeria monocytogenes]|uniref:ParB N-terminal domain-containing protein n=1 Tax=Listeria monocytogenes TaxID=1639 RepID=UPI000766D8E2|nr:ParB N-terminal domain-containing protein [Listeria monocytogenes]EAC9467697.1 transcriptional regulator [Listeria monocytogenes]EAD0460529.1 transcriptional regulator [Listeria monocytogenes]EAD6997205.1 transcriptional regulator [Listeria monocytogenes]EAD9986440.1 transcriptional regulator [Listeria monocytogenes]EAE4847780.1 transcriptional regulator [Listeria monocytogenes]